MRGMLSVLAKQRLFFFKQKFGFHSVTLCPSCSSSTFGQVGEKDRGRDQTHRVSLGPAVPWQVAAARCSLRSPAMLGTRMSSCAGSLPVSLRFFGLLLLPHGTENRVPSRPVPTLCREFSHRRSGTGRSLTQTQQVPLDRISSLPARTVHRPRHLSGMGWESSSARGCRCQHHGAALISPGEAGWVGAGGIFKAVCLLSDTEEHLDVLEGEKVSASRAP